MSRIGGTESLYGLSEQFRVGDYQRVESVIGDLKRLGVRRLRTPVSMHDFATPAGRAWYEWLFPALAGNVELLPCFASQNTAPDSPGERYVELLDEILAVLGAYISHVELCSIHAADSDPRLDSAAAHCAETLGDAVHHIRERGKRVVLSVSAPVYGGWLELLGARGVLREIDAIGLQGFPQRSDLGTPYWPRRLERVHEVLSRHGSQADIWITETGYANSGSQDRAQLRAFLESVEAPAQRVYWHSVRDADADADADYEDESPHLGLYDSAGAPRLLARLLAEGGPARVHETLAFAIRGSPRNGKGVALITGGAGFIGTNLAQRLLAEGKTVRILDNLSRPGTERNLRWLLEHHGEHVEFTLADVRDRRALREAISDAAEIYHFAAQVAVTTSLADPLNDFENNGRGTLNLLEELRRLDKPPPLLFTSTNKVYGGLEDLALHVGGTRYELADPDLRPRGVDETHPLAFCSPYGCSKGSADQYVLDFAKTYQIPAAVLRMSCIYGPHQFGTEDQGWVAHFMRSALARQPITIYGDGRQVRDILFVEDLVEAMIVARDCMEAIRGKPFNIGGGAQNSISLLELLAELDRLHGISPQVSFEAWRASDQRYYVSDTSRFSAATGWKPRVHVREGLERLNDWLAAQHPPIAVEPAAGRIAL